MLGAKFLWLVVEKAAGLVVDNNAQDMLATLAVSSLVQRSMIAGPALNDKVRHQAVVHKVLQTTL